MNRSSGVENLTKSAEVAVCAIEVEAFSTWESINSAVSDWLLGYQML